MANPKYLTDFISCIHRKKKFKGKTKICKWTSTLLFMTYRIHKCADVGAKIKTIYVPNLPMPPGLKFKFQKVNLFSGTDPGFFMQASMRAYCIFSFTPLPTCHAWRSCKINALLSTSYMIYGKIHEHCWFEAPINNSIDHIISE